MSEVLKESLASWCDAHGFGILCIHGSRGERFVVVANDETKATSVSDRGFRLWEGVSEAELRAQLAAAGFAEVDVEGAIHLARDWATTITPGRGLWGLSS